MKKFIKILALTVGFAILAFVLYIRIMSSAGFGASVRLSEDVFTTGVDGMVYSSTDIVRGVILDERVERMNTMITPPDGPTEWYLSMRQESYFLHTIHRIRVTEVFKGDSQIGDIIEIAQIGGRLFLSQLTNLSMVAFEIGDDIVVFMETYYNSHGIHRPASLISTFQSVYRAISTSGMTFPEGIVSAYNTNSGLADTALENFSEGNDIELTIGELMWVRYEAGLGQRPQHDRPKVVVDLRQLIEDIARAEHYMQQYYMLPGWDDVQDLLEEAMRVRDNPYARQLQVNHASWDLRHSMRILGVDTNAPVQTPIPTPTPAPEAQLTLDIFNNGPGGSQSRPNANLAQSGTIRIWTQLDGVNTPLPMSAVITYEDGVATIRLGESNPDDDSVITCEEVRGKGTVEKYLCMSCQEIKERDEVSVVTENI